MGGSLRSFYPVHGAVDCCSGEQRGVLADGRQLHTAEPGELTVVVAEYRNVSGTFSPSARKLSITPSADLSVNTMTTVGRLFLRDLVGVSGLRTLERLAVLGEKHGVTFTLENLNTILDHPGIPLARAKDTLALVSAVDRPNVKMMLDLHHAQIGEGNLIELVRAAMRGRLHQNRVVSARCSWPPRVGLGYVVSERVPRPGVRFCHLGADHFSGRFALLAAGGFGMVGEGVNDEALPALPCLAGKVLTHSRRTLVASLHFSSAAADMRKLVHVALRPVFPTPSIWP